MEIKTEHDIFWNYDSNTHKNKNKKWVSVENEIEFLEDLYKGLDNYPLTKGWNITHSIKNHIKQLKGEQK